MKSFRTVVPMFVLGLAALTGCSGVDNGANTGASTNAIAATDEASPDAKKAGGPRAGRPHGGPDFLVFAALHEDIGLSPEQRTTIQALVEKSHPKDGARPQPDKSKIAELAAAVRSGSVDATKLKNDRGDAMMQQHIAASATKLKTLHDTLGKDQRAKLVDAVAAKHAQRPEGPPKGGPGGEHGPRGEHGAMGPGGHMLEGLDVTDAQKAEIKAKLEANRPAPPSEAERAAMKAAMDAKLQSFKADAFDANAFVQPPANMPNGHADAMAKDLQVIVSVLTPAQREKLAQKIEQGPPARR